MENWIWLIFISFGLVLIMLELLLGIDTGFDLVFLGSAFILGGLVTWPFHSWVITLVVTLVVCVLYLVLGRKYVHRWRVVKSEKTNVDALIERQGIVLEDLQPGEFGMVKVGDEKWRATASELIRKGEMIVVKEIKGVTVKVEKYTGGN